MIPFGRQILGAAGKAGKRAARMPGNRPVRWAGRKGKKLTKSALSGPTVAPVLSRIPGSRKVLFDKGLYSLGSKSVGIGMGADKSLAAKRITSAGKRGASKPDFFPRISGMSPGKKKAIGAAALTGIGINGFMSGVDNNNQVSNSVYNLAFGDPDYDKYVMGKKMGVRSLIAPLPGETRMRAYSPTTYADAWRASRKQQPRVDGSIAFGMYNSRLG